MMKELFYLQLAFNALMFVAIIALARSLPRRPYAGRAARDDTHETPRAPTPPALEIPPPRPDAHLAELLAGAEEQQLVAEQQLRARLARYRAAHAGGRGPRAAAG